MLAECCGTTTSTRVPLLGTETIRYWPPTSAALSSMIRLP
jgi:hypothetical protein